MAVHGPPYCGGTRKHSIVPRPGGGVPCRIERGSSKNNRSQYIPERMKLSLVRLVATLLLSGQMSPLGLPLLCQRATSASCDQQMASHRSGPVVAATTDATPCVNSAFCATTATAVVAL